MRGGEKGEESSPIVAPPSWALAKALWRLARSLRLASRKVRKVLSYLRSASRKVRLLPASSCTLARETGWPSGPGGDWTDTSREARSPLVELEKLSMTVTW